MGNFTVQLTASDGKSLQMHNIPEGTSPQQVLELAKRAGISNVSSIKKLSSEATSETNSLNSPSPSTSSLSSAGMDLGKGHEPLNKGEIGRQGLIGAAVGFASPELAMGVGKALQLMENPMARVAGTAIFDWGLAARAMPGARTSEVLKGLAGGLTQEAAGEYTHDKGLLTESAARLAGAFGGETAVTAAASIFGAAKSGIAIISKRLLGVDSVNPVGDKKLAALRGINIGEVPVNVALHKTVRELNTQAIHVAAKKVKDLQDTAIKYGALYPKESLDALKRAAVNYNQLKLKAEAGIQDTEKLTGVTMDQAQALSQGSSHAIQKTFGVPVHPEQLGNTLQLAARHQANLDQAQASASFEVTKNLIQKKATSLEAAGKSIKSTPAYTDLMQYMKTTFQNHADSGIRNFLKGKFTDLARKGLTYEGADAIRANLGKAFSGNPPVGYEAIPKSMAKTLYFKVAEAQKQFTGMKAEQEAINAEYSQLKTEQEAAVNPVGHALLTFGADGLPVVKGDAALRQIFDSPDSIARTNAILKNSDLLSKIAESHISNILNGHSSAKMEQLVEQHGNWLPLFPSAAGKSKQVIEDMKQIEENVKGTATTLQGVDRQLSSSLKSIQKYSKLDSPADVIPFLTGAKSQVQGQLFKHVYNDAYKETGSKIKAETAVYNTARWALGFQGTVPSTKLLWMHMEKGLDASGTLSPEFKADLKAKVEDYIAHRNKLHEPATVRGLKAAAITGAGQVGKLIPTGSSNQ